MGRVWQWLRWFFEKPRVAPEAPAGGVRQPLRRRAAHADGNNLTFLKLKAAVVQRRFESARTLLRELAADPTPQGDASDAPALLCEAVADDLREWDRDGSIWLYEQALVYFQEFAVWASTGGEGSRRMDSVGRVESKLRQLRAAGII